MSHVGSPLPNLLSPVAETVGHFTASESLNWFAVYTTSRHEKKVAEHFGLRGIENFLPLYAARPRWKNRSTPTLQIPLFANYIFVRISCRERVQVLAVPGVLSIVSRGRDPVVLSDLEIETLHSGLHLRRAEPYPYLRIGTRARIRSGPLAGLEGVLLREKNGFRVVLTVNQIGKSIAVEVDADELEPLAQHLLRRIPTSDCRP